MKGRPPFTRYFDLVGAPAPMRARILEELGAPARHWHGLVHHALMLRFVSRAGLDRLTTARLVLATLFHDIVYDARRSDNEEASAALAREWLGGEQAEAVAALILATKRHDLATDPVTRAFLEADLGVLWTPSARLYRFYAQGIRAEYAHVPDEAYRAGRSEVLRRLQDQLAPYLDGARSAQLARNLDGERDRLIAGEYDLSR